MTSYKSRGVQTHLLLPSSSVTIFHPSLVIGGMSLKLNNFYIIKGHLHDVLLLNQYISVVLADRLLGKTLR